jgi:serine protease Do
VIEVKKGNQKSSARKKTSPAKATGRRRSPSLAAVNIADVVERYKNAVVNLEVVRREKEQRPGRRNRDLFGNLFPEDMEENVRKSMNIGTGFFFDPRGYIFTNEHVIHGAEEIFVRFYDQEEGVPARVVGASYEMDLAILKVDPPKNMKTLPFGKSSALRQGDWVVAIGCPLGLDHTVTVGIISAKERPITIGDRHYPQLLQTDAAINRGNSGGPLINLKGEVIGMNTAVSASSQGIGFAIPIDVVKKAISKLMGENKPGKKKE